MVAYACEAKVLMLQPHPIWSQEPCLGLRNRLLCQQDFKTQEMKCAFLRESSQQLEVFLVLSELVMVRSNRYTVVQSAHFPALFPILLKLRILSAPHGCPTPSAAALKTCTFLLSFSVTVISYPGSSSAVCGGHKH